MASLGPRFPGTTASLANAGTSENAEAWVNPGNIVSDNGSEAAITAASYDSPDISQLLVASNFGFTVPAGSTIDGIIVEIDRRNSAGAASDNRVQLAKGTTFASLVGNNKADTATDWPGSAAIATYGASNDLWGTTWTVTEINASSFAVMLSVQADSANTDIQVDYIRVTVHYTAPPPIELIGSGAGGSTGDGVLTTSINLRGVSVAGATGLGNLTTQILLAGLAAGVSTGQAAFAELPLVGSAEGGSTAVGLLTTAIRLAGTAGGASAGAAALATAIRLAGSAAGAAAGAANITTAIKLAGLAEGTSTGDGRLSTGGPKGYDAAPSFFFFPPLNGAR